MSAGARSMIPCAVSMRDPKIKRVLSGPKQLVQHRFGGRRRLPFPDLVAHRLVPPPAPVVAVDGRRSARQSKRMASGRAPAAAIGSSPP